jgi:hypothetical protein
MPKGQSGKKKAASPPSNKKKASTAAKTLAKRLLESGEIVGKSRTHWVVKDGNNRHRIRKSAAVDGVFSKTLKRQKQASEFNIYGEAGGTDDGGYNVAGDTSS